MMRRDDDRTGETSDASSSDLCRDCGLCCDGSIFDYVRLDGDEFEAAAAHGLDPGFGQSGARFALPCPRFHSVCQIYPDRPSRCRRYRCALLERLEVGEVTFETAHATVAEARRLANEAERTAQTGEDRAGSRRRWTKAFATMTRGAENARPEPHGDPHWLLAMTALNVHLDRHFRRPHQRRLSGGMDSPEILAKD